jgi:dTDP-4-amino-4,6-dideoxygalactose transaminase
MSGHERHFIDEAFESNYIAPLGPQVDRFEQEFAAAVGIPHALAVASGTAALHLALVGLRIVPGDLVYTSTLTFIGGVSPICYTGAIPVFIDSEPSTWNMDPILFEEELEAARHRGRLPKAVIVTELYGQCVDLERFSRICTEFNVELIVDAAESVGSVYTGNRSRTGARSFAFSFNGNKIITTSGGGMLCSQDAALIERARFLSQQARDPASHYEHSEIGFNYRMSNVLAAIGRGQLMVLGEKVESKRRIFNRYVQAFKGTPGIRFMPEASYNRANRWLTVALIDAAEFGIDREELRIILESNNIESRPVWKPMHMQPVFRGLRVVGGRVAEDLFRHGLCLPSGTSMTDDDVDRVASIILKSRP